MSVTDTTERSKRDRTYSITKSGAWLKLDTPSAPAEPSDKVPSFTRAQATQLQNPPPSISSQAKNAGGVMDKVKTANDISGSAYKGGGLDTSMGILQKVLRGKA